MQTWDIVVYVFVSLILSLFVSVYFNYVGEYVDNVLNSCENGAELLNGICDCSGIPFSGKNCQTPSCANGGFVVYDTVNEHTVARYPDSLWSCYCRGKYSGFECEICNAVGADCSGDCLPGYSGVHCQNSCFSNLTVDTRYLSSDAGLRCSSSILNGGKCSYCSGNGNCVNGACECEYGFYGSTCSSVCPRSGGLFCGGHGECAFKDGNPSCVCQPGFAGAACEYSCPNNCGGVGLCVMGGSCVCPDRMRGAGCEYMCPGVSVCSGRGICNGVGVCECSSSGGVAWQGESCNCHRELTCSGHGSCDNGCKCDPNYTGSRCNVCIADHYGRDCDVVCVASVDCNGRGVCSSSGVCQCDAGWTGLGCDSCEADIYPKTYVTPPIVTFNWVSDFCQQTITRSICYDHGVPNPLFGTSLYSSIQAGFYPCQCDGNYDPGSMCESCLPNWYGDCDVECSVSICNGGSCREDGSCSCAAGVYGEYCTSTCAVVDGLVCSGHGACVDEVWVDGLSTKCECDAGYEGASCHLTAPVAFGSTCNGRGVAKITPVVHTGLTFECHRDIDCGDFSGVPSFEDSRMTTAFQNAFIQAVFGRVGPSKPYGPLCHRRLTPSGVSGVPGAVGQHSMESWSMEATSSGPFFVESPGGFYYPLYTSRLSSQVLGLSERIDLLGGVIFYGPPSLEVRSSVECSKLVDKAHAIAVGCSWVDGLCSHLMKDVDASSWCLRQSEFARLRCSEVLELKCDDLDFACGAVCPFSSVLNATRAWDSVNLDTPFNGEFFEYPFSTDFSTELRASFHVGETCAGVLLWDIPVREYPSPRWWCQYGSDKYTSDTYSAGCTAIDSSIAGFVGFVVGGVSYASFRDALSEVVSGSALEYGALSEYGVTMSVSEMCAEHYNSSCPATWHSDTASDANVTSAYFRYTFTLTDYNVGTTVVFTNTSSYNESLLVVTHSSVMSLKNGTHVESGPVLALNRAYSVLLHFVNNSVICMGEACPESLEVSGTFTGVRMSESGASLSSLHAFDDLSCEDGSWRLRIPPGWRTTKSIYALCEERDIDAPAADWVDLCAHRRDFQQRYPGTDLSRSEVESCVRLLSNECVDLVGECAKWEDLGRPTRDVCEVHSSNPTGVSKCDGDWTQWCDAYKESTLPGTCAILDCQCDSDSFIGVAGDACELTCPVHAETGTACGYMDPPEYSFGTCATVEYDAFTDLHSIPSKCDCHRSNLDNCEELCDAYNTPDCNAGEYGSETMRSFDCWGFENDIVTYRNPLNIIPFDECVEYLKYHPATSVVHAGDSGICRWDPVSISWGGSIGNVVSTLVVSESRCEELNVGMNLYVADGASALAIGSPYANGVVHEHGYKTLVRGPVAHGVVDVEFGSDMTGVNMVGGMKVVLTVDGASSVVVMYSGTRLVTDIVGRGSITYGGAILPYSVPTRSTIWYSRMKSDVLFPVSELNGVYASAMVIPGFVYTRGDPRASTSKLRVPLSVTSSTWSLNRITVDAVLDGPVTINGVTSEVYSSNQLLLPRDAVFGSMWIGRMASLSDVSLLSAYNVAVVHGDSVVIKVGDELRNGGAVLKVLQAFPSVGGTDTLCERSGIDDGSTSMTLFESIVEVDVTPHAFPESVCLLEFNETVDVSRGIRLTQPTYNPVLVATTDGVCTPVASSLEECEDAARMYFDRDAHVVMIAYATGYPSGCFHISRSDGYGDNMYWNKIPNSVECSGDLTCLCVGVETVDVSSAVVFSSNGPLVTILSADNWSPGSCSHGLLLSASCKTLVKMDVNLPGATDVQQGLKSGTIFHTTSTHVLVQTDDIVPGVVASFKFWRNVGEVDIASSSSQLSVVTATADRELSGTIATDVSIGDVVLSSAASVTFVTESTSWSNGPVVEGMVVSSDPLETESIYSVSIDPVLLRLPSSADLVKSVDGVVDSLLLTRSLSVGLNHLEFEVVFSDSVELGTYEYSFSSSLQQIGDVVGLVARQGSSIGVVSAQSSSAVIVESSDAFVSGSVVFGSPTELSVTLTPASGITKVETSLGETMCTVANGVHIWGNKDDRPLAAVPVPVTATETKDVVILTVSTSDPCTPVASFEECEDVSRLYHGSNVNVIQGSYSNYPSGCFRWGNPGSSPFFYWNTQQNSYQCSETSACLCREIIEIPVDMTKIDTGFCPAAVESVEQCEYLSTQLTSGSVTTIHSSVYPAGCSINRGLYFFNAAPSVYECSASKECLCGPEACSAKDLKPHHPSPLVGVGPLCSYNRTHLVAGYENIGNLVDALVRTREECFSYLDYHPAVELLDTLGSDGYGSETCTSNLTHVAWGSPIGTLVGMPTAEVHFKISSCSGGSCECSPPNIAEFYRTKTSISGARTRRRETRYFGKHKRSNMMQGPQPFLINHVKYQDRPITLANWEQMYDIWVVSRSGFTCSNPSYAKSGDPCGSNTLCVEHSESCDSGVCRRGSSKEEYVGVWTYSQCLVDNLLLSSLQGTSAYMGPLCMDKCPEITEFGTPCSGHGVCSSTGTCSCDIASTMVRYTQNTREVINNREGKPLISFVGQETMTMAERTGWRGNGCEMKCPGYDAFLSDMTGICTGHGQCNADTSCSCEIGYTGDNCQLDCPNTKDVSHTTCNGHGACQEGILEVDESGSSEINSAVSTALMDWKVQCPLPYDDHVEMVSTDVDPAVDVLDEDCKIMVSDNCFKTVEYTNNESCKLSVFGYLHVKSFHVEIHENCKYDSLTVNDVKYCGVTGPDNVFVNGEVAWSTDANTVGNGFEICVVLPPTLPPVRVSELKFYDSVQSTVDTYIDARGTKFTATVVNNTLMRSMDLVYPVQVLSVGPVELVHDEVEHYRGGAECDSTMLTDASRVRPQVNISRYSDFGSVRSACVETLELTQTCDVLPHDKLRCAMCACPPTNANGFWGGLDCRTCELGFGGGHCKTKCPGYDGVSSNTICGGLGTCTWGSEEGSGDVFSIPSCICGDAPDDGFGSEQCDLYVVDTSIEPDDVADPSNFEKNGGEDVCECVSNKFGQKCEMSEPVCLFKGVPQLDGSCECKSEGSVILQESEGCCPLGYTLKTQIVVPRFVTDSMVFLDDFFKYDTRAQNIIMDKCEYTPNCPSVYDRDIEFTRQENITNFAHYWNKLSRGIPLFDVECGEGGQCTETSGELMSFSVPGTMVWENVDTYKKCTEVINMEQCYVLAAAHARDHPLSPPASVRDGAFTYYVAPAGCLLFFGDVKHPEGIYIFNDVPPNSIECSSLGGDMFCIPLGLECVSYMKPLSEGVCVDIVADVTECKNESEATDVSESFHVDRPSGCYKMGSNTHFNNATTDIPCSSEFQCICKRRLDAPMFMNDYTYELPMDTESITQTIYKYDGHFESLSECHVSIIPSATECRDAIHELNWEVAYTPITTSVCPTDVSSIELCERFAKMRDPDSYIIVMYESKSYYPSGCYQWGTGTYFFNGYLSTADCSNSQITCICDSSLTTVWNPLFPPGCFKTNAVSSIGSEIGMVDNIIYFNNEFSGDTSNRFFAPVSVEYACRSFSDSREHTTLMNETVFESIFPTRIRTSGSCPSVAASTARCSELANNKGVTVISSATTPFGCHVYNDVLCFNRNRPADKIPCDEVNQCVCDDEWTAPCEFKSLVDPINVILGDFVFADCTVRVDNNCLKTVPYGNSQSCRFKIHGYLNVKSFDVESHETCAYDSLTVNNVKYCGQTGPNNIFVDGIVDWSTDQNTVGDGFEICVSSVQDGSSVNKVVLHPPPLQYCGLTSYVAIGTPPCVGSNCECRCVDGSTGGSCLCKQGASMLTGVDFRCPACGMIDCCTLGAFRHPINMECTLCPGGKVVNDNGDECDTCSPDSKSTLGGCEQCPLGRVVDDTKTSCIECAPGKVIQNYRCETCEPGKYVTGAHPFTTCTTCNIGLYESNSECVSCPAGRIGVKSGEISTCEDCPLFKTSGERDTVCVNCAPGQYKPVGSVACTGCPAGFIHPTEPADIVEFKSLFTGFDGALDDGEVNPGGNYCLPTWSHNQYQDQTGQTEFKSCPSGKVACMVDWDYALPDCQYPNDMPNVVSLESHGWDRRTLDPLGPEFYVVPGTDWNIDGHCGFGTAVTLDECKDLAKKHKGSDVTVTVQELNSRNFYPSGCFHLNNEWVDGYYFNGDGLVMADVPYYERLDDYGKECTSDKRCICSSVKIYQSETCVRRNIPVTSCQSCLLGSPVPDRDTCLTGNRQHGCSYFYGFEIGGFLDNKPRTWDWKGDLSWEGKLYKKEGKEWV